MVIEQIYTGCLAQGAYYITSEGEAAIIDPLREPAPYLERLRRDGATLRYVFETHFHADFVSGHLDLSRATGAPIVYGPTAQPRFDALIATDGQEFTVGKLRIRAIHTPGHTLESTSYLLFDETGRAHCLFSGDTLFLGDVGRPDLAQKAANMTQEELAGLLYDSLYQKILTLPDDLIVYPAHGAGSACGKNMMKETLDTLGHQKKINYALNQPDKARFIQKVTEGLLPPPGYFGMNVQLNKTGYAGFDEVKASGLRALTPEAAETLADERDLLLLDTRSAAAFAEGHVPGSVNIGLDGDFAPWVGAMIVDVRQPLLLITEPGREEEAVTRLSRVGFDRVTGYLAGGFEAWKQSGRPVELVDRISAQTFAETVRPGVDRILDLRRPSEFETAHLEGAENRPLERLNEWIGTLDPKQHVFLHCAGGYRSMIAAGILQARGYRRFSDVAGGFSAIRAETTCPVVTGTSTCTV